MGLADQLSQAKTKLTSTKTKVTTIDGKVYVEEKGKREKLDERCSGFVVDTKPDMNLSLIVPPWLYIGSQDVAANAELLRWVLLQLKLSVLVGFNSLSDSGCFLTLYWLKAIKRLSPKFVVSSVKF